MYSEDRHFCLMALRSLIRQYTGSRDDLAYELAKLIELASDTDDIYDLLDEAESYEGTDF